MKNYAIALYFDSTTEETIQRLIDNAADASGNRYMQAVGIPPHVTLCAVVSDNETALIAALDSICPHIAQGAVAFASIGVFNPKVLFLSPVMNEYLLAANQTINQSLLPLGEAGDFGHYLPYQWVPHAALAVQLTPEQLQQSFAAVQAEFAPIAGTANRLVLASCNPFEEIRIWSLR